MTIATFGRRQEHRLDVAAESAAIGAIIVSLGRTVVRCFGMKRRRVRKPVALVNVRHWKHTRA